ncbi:uncharacterized protein LOC143281007 [Babylonia areolata]|uniref:uncharacterized protein LOC143281007 n=1 Tax=Babylonia areolata TaxID=304850 RepID=UPI003FD22725
MNQPPGSRNRDGSLPFYRKVLLAAAMTGSEICVSFQQLYQVPLLQIQGVPVTYVSLYPIVAGPVALLLLNLSGRLSDRGSNHQKRKAIVVALIAAITMLGIALVVVANSNLLSVDECTGSSNATTCFEELREPENQSHFTFTNESFLTSDDFPAMVTAVTNHSAARRESSLDDEDTLSVPVTALLGLSGFTLMDIGYDVNQASIRTSVLASSSQSDHSVLLLLSLALAAFGGCITNTLGLLDLSQLFGWGAEDGSVVAQTTVQLLVCGLVLVVTVTSTVTTALLGTPTLRPPAFTPLHEDGTESEQIACYGTFGSDERSPQNDDDRHDRNLCSEETNFGRREERTVDESDTFEESVVSATKPLVSEKERSLQFSYSSTFEHLNLLNGNILHHSIADQRSSSPHLSSEVAQQKSEFPASEQSRWNKHKVNFITACASAYLGFSIIFSYNLYVTDFLGKAVMGGDSNAPHDSAEFKQYEGGLRLGAGGLFTFYCSYFLFNCVHSKLLAFWGMKVDFCLSHGLMAAAVLCLALTKQLAVFYVCCVLYGFNRAALFSVPFIIANDYAQKQEHSGHGQSVTGRLMAIVGCMVPLNYCTLFLFSGPLITLTNHDGAPLILSSVCTGLASLLFMVFYRP